MYTDRYRTIHVSSFSLFLYNYLLGQPTVIHERREKCCWLLTKTPCQLTALSAIRGVQKKQLSTFFYSRGETSVTIIGQFFKIKMSSTISSLVSLHCKRKPLCKDGVLGYTMGAIRLHDMKEFCRKGSVDL